MPQACAVGLHVIARVFPMNGSQSAKYSQMPCTLFCVHCKALAASLLPLMARGSSDNATHFTTAPCLTPQVSSTINEFILCLLPQLPCLRPALTMCKFQKACQSSRIPPDTILSRLSKFPCAFTTGIRAYELVPSNIV